MHNQSAIRTNGLSLLHGVACAPMLLGLVGACGDDDAKPPTDDTAAGQPGTGTSETGAGGGGGSGSSAGAGVHAGGEHDHGGRGGENGSEIGGAAGSSGLSGWGGETAGAGGTAGDCAADAAAASIALSVGHVDVMSLSVDCHGELVIWTRDDTAPLGALLRRPDSVLIHGGPEAALEVPPDLPPEYAFLGPAGSTVWVLPEVQLQAVVWPGWDLAGVPSGAYDDDQLTLRLDSVSGPGRFVGYHSDFVPAIVFDLEQGLDEVQMSPGSHAHLEWFFSAPGLYELAFTVEASLDGGARSISQQTRHRFFLGNLQDLPQTQATVVVVDGLQQSYAVGDTLEVTARSYGATIAAEPSWLRQCVIDWDSHTLTAWQLVGTGENLAHTLAAADANCQFRAVLRDGGDELATSQSFLISLR